MDVAELPVMWEMLAARARSGGAEEAAQAMAEEMQRIVRGLVSHPGRGAPGSPPGLETGHLREMIRIIPAVGGGDVGIAKVGSFAVYAAVQEFGAVIWPNPPRRYLHWVDSRGSMYLKSVIIKPHPYMRTARDIGVSTGRFRRAALRFISFMGFR